MKALILALAVMASTNVVMAQEDCQTYLKMKNAITNEAMAQMNCQEPVEEGSKIFCLLERKIEQCRIYEDSPELDKLRSEVNKLRSEIRHLEDELRYLKNDVSYLSNRVKVDLDENSEDPRLKDALY